MRKKSEKTKLKDKIHSVMREIRLRDEPRCVICGDDGSKSCLQLGHLITRGANSVRFDWRNLHTQCLICNNIHEYRPEIYTLWFINKYGKEEYESLVRDSKQIKQWKMGELRELLEEMKELRDLSKR